MAEPRLSVEIDADASGATRGFDRAGDAAEDMAKRVKRAGRGAQVANDNFRKASRGSSSFGRAVQNASFQVGDFATQVGAGTSASIALGQQLPQLIGGFGVLGAALGAVVAIGVPLVRVLGEMDASAADLEKVFGVLTPAILSIGDALSFVKDTGIAAIEGLINNLDALLISGGLVASFFVGKYVASMVAAKVATISLAGALSVLKKALLVTGIGALVVAAGHLIERFIALRNELGTFAEAAGLVGDVIEASFRHVFKRIEATWFGAWNSMIDGLIGILDGKLPNIAARLMAMNEPIKAAFESANAAAQRYEETHDRLMAKILNAGQTSKFSLADLLNGGSEAGAGEGEGAGASEEERNKEQLAAKLKNITDSFLSEKELLYAQLAEKQMILDEAHNQELLNEQEHLKASEQLRKQHGDKIAAIEQAKRNTMLTQAANTFGALQSMAMSFGKKGAKVAQVFGLAKALISTFTGAAKALELPFPANIAAFAQVLATGMGAVASIKGVNTNGGGNSASGGGRGAAPVAAAPKPLEVMIQGLGANDLITGGQLSSLFDKLVDEAGDRGIRPVFA